MRGLSVIVLVGLVAPAVAQPKDNLPTLVGATEVAKLVPPASFIDDAVAADGDRIAYVIADSSTKAELHVVTLATKQEQIAELAPLTLHPLSLRFVGKRVFVVGKTADGRQVGALIDPAAKKKVLYRVPPASHITVITRDGKQRIAVHRAAPAPSRIQTRHTVELLALETGRRIGAARSLDLDGTGGNVKLELRVNHWSDGFTRAHGIMSGAWDKKENERAPDGEATLDVLTGKVIDRHPIKDLFEQRKRFAVLADASERGDFIRFTETKTALELWRGGKKRALELDQPLASYDPPSLFASVAADGSAWLALKVDPVNPAAVARKKTDPEYLDIFRAAPDGKAVRKARILASGVRHRFGSGSDDRFWVLERNQSIERGGKALTIYQLQ
jgi:hypothetical protein